MKHHYPWGRVFPKIFVAISILKKFSHFFIDVFL